MSIITKKHLKKTIFTLLSLTISINLFYSPAFAQHNPSEPPAALGETQESFHRGEIVEIVNEGERSFGEDKEFFQEVKVKVLDGEEQNQQIEIEHSEFVTESAQKKKLQTGQTVVLHKVENSQEKIFMIVDTYRIPALIGIFIIFLLLVVLFGKKQGLSAIFGLIVSIIIIVKWIIPSIVTGTNPLLVCLFGAYAIAIFSLYTAHGLNKRTTLAVISTLITLTIAFVLSIIFVDIAKLFGMGSEEAFYLQMSSLQSVSLQGLLLGGIIIGALGVLDDVTAAQVAAVDELNKANPLLSMKELYKHGISIGKEHIASMINTLALAYVGASFPLLLLFTINKNQPLWTLFNSEFIAEEIIRTLVGSTTLIFAVPISTILAAYIYGKKTKHSN